MTWKALAGRADLHLLWLVALGVAAAGLYDFSQGDPPSGLFGFDANLSLGVFLVGCLSAAALGTKLTALGPDPSRTRLRTMLVAVGLVPAVFSDPTYASLIVIIPLIDVRRHDEEPVRTIGVVGMLGAVTALVLTEGTRRTTTEVEGMLGLAIALLVVVLLGDLLRELDRRIEAEAELAQMAERSRLAEDIHDSLGHHLLASSVQLQTAQALQRIDPDRSATAVEYASQAVAEAISETRLIVDAGRNGDGVAIEASLRELANRIVPSETAISLDVTGDFEVLDSSRRIAVYRVVQEALTNLVRHSGANTASVVTGVDEGGVSIVVTDDGAGFEADQSGRPGGISNMRRRVEDLGGRFEIESGPGGTTVTATVPT